MVGIEKAQGLKVPSFPLEMDGELGISARVSGGKVLSTHLDIFKTLQPLIFLLKKASKNLIYLDDGYDSLHSHGTMRANIADVIKDTGFIELL